MKQLTFKRLNKQINKKNNRHNNKKTGKIALSCNLRRISFFKRCVKAVAAVFMFLFQIFGPRNGIFFCPLIVLQSGISNVICDLVLWLFTEGINISFRQDDAIPCQYLKTIVVHSYTLRSTRSLSIFLKWDGFLSWVYATRRELQAKTYALYFEQFSSYFEQIAIQVLAIQVIEILISLFAFGFPFSFNLYFFCILSWCFFFIFLPSNNAFSLPRSLLSSLT